MRTNKSTSFQLSGGGSSLFHSLFFFVYQRFNFCMFFYPFLSENFDGSCRAIALELRLFSHINWFDNLMGARETFPRMNIERCILFWLVGYYDQLSVCTYLKLYLFFANQRHDWAEVNNELQLRANCSEKLMFELVRLYFPSGPNSELP
jgi:hypothetical protein